MNHSVKSANRKPSFFWQGVLILAPVLVLAIIGVVALTGDKRLVRHEAEVRAQDVADQAVDLIWAELQSTNEAPAVATSMRLQRGWKSFWPSVTLESRTRVFYTTQVTRWDLDHDGRVMVATDPAHLRQQQLHQEVFRAVEARLSSYASNFVRTATNTTALELPQTSTPTVFWVTLPMIPTPITAETNDKPRPVTQTRWLVVHQLTKFGSTVLCRPEVFAQQAVQSALSRVRKPEYMEATVRLADVDVLASTSLALLEYVKLSKGSGQAWTRTTTTNTPPVLASAVKFDGGAPALFVRMHLVSPDLLYARYRDRALLLGFVVVVAALVSVFGFYSARRAFEQQLRLSELKSDFVASVSHELRAPLASVRLMAEGLERGKISEPVKQQEYFHFITQECRRLSSMVENVLDFARIEQGRKEYELQPTDIVALVEQTVKLMEPNAAERDVTLRVENFLAPTSNLQPTLDGAAMQQALVNLIDNAIKHSPSGSQVVVSVSLNSQPSAVNVSVRDQGPGIPAAEHDKIFDRFYRFGSELRRETSGVGIGLSIVKHIVEAHGGRVHVESQVGKGSCFTIELPLTAETQA
jgi:signal transduction histidine kinase